MSPKPELSEEQSSSLLLAESLAEVFSILPKGSLTETAKIKVENAFNSYLASN